MDKNIIDPAKSIPSFYAGQSIFLTGATGFIGKVYIEKILRSCPDVREIFILMRPKKSININERLEKMLSLPLFDKLREKQSSNFKKLIPIFGDISQENFNLSVADRQMLIERVTIIIHNAASVKFNDSLKYAVLTNIRSTRDICILAENIKNLMALVYVGTAYTHLDNPFIEEKVYPPIANWRKMIKVAEILDEHNLSIFTAKCLDYIPNTYLFSKNLAESVIHEYSSSLPCAIVRPSIVINSWKDPIPGWLDTFNGPMGLGTFGGKGLLRVLYGHNYTLQNHIPIDIVINTIILVTWKLGLTTFTPTSTLLIINCTFPDEKNISFGEKGNIMLKFSKKMPFEGIVWTPAVVYTKSLIIYYMLTMLWHFVPAIIIDSILKFSGYRPMVLGLQRKAYVANHALQHFMCNEWKFDNTNSRNLMSLIPSDDRETFSIDLSDFDMINYLSDAVIGAKKYLLHEDMNRLEAAKTHYKRVDLFVRTFKTVIIIGILWMIYKCM